MWGATSRHAAFGRGALAGARGVGWGAGRWLGRGALAGARGMRCTVEVRCACLALEAMLSASHTCAAPRQCERRHGAWGGAGQRGAGGAQERSGAYVQLRCVAHRCATQVCGSCSSGVRGVQLRCAAQVCGVCGSGVQLRCATKVCGPAVRGVAAHALRCLHLVVAPLLGLRRTTAAATTTRRHLVRLAPHPLA